ncbi:hypothetical protein PM10SUCC1_05430 [Propionigenium maris DSM 9537]|uniref:histidine kinase n=1 Tax=Propionigenium maris DSM 9537 TaxID=1123000 RepID=A0A9W6GGW5_9FUSO|nr:ATP-binding protein [Propionigenium maris]GLI55028.1 hypothetical protein PM10SUCC1_05430 [Propionigenium maris DSM 9537]
MKKFINSHINTLGKKIYFSYGVSVFIILFTLNTSASIFFYSWERNRSMNVILGIENHIQKQIAQIEDLDDMKQLEDFGRNFNGNIIRDISADLGKLSIKVWKDEKKILSHREVKYNIAHDEELGDFQIKRYDKETYIVYNNDFKIRGSSFVIQIIGSMKFVITDLFTLLKSLFGANILALILAYYSGKILHSSIIVPINEITKTTQKINRYALNQRIKVINDKDELGKLSVTINNMVERLEMAFKNQETFISNASHELRTPLTVIKGYVDLLDAGAKGSPEIVDKAVAEIKHESLHMNNLISTLLFIARKENMALKGEAKAINISDLLSGLMEKQELIDKVHLYTANIQRGIVMHTVEDLFSMLVRELLKNASKYTPEGKNIILSLTGDESNIYMVVEDEGVGIEKEDLENIFKRFYKSDKVRNRSAKSYGLGMSIVKNIVEFHKAKIDVESEVGVGTRIMVTFPTKNYI